MRLPYVQFEDRSASIEVRRRTADDDESVRENEEALEMDSGIVLQEILQGDLMYDRHLLRRVSPDNGDLRSVGDIDELAVGFDTIQLVHAFDLDVCAGVSRLGIAGQHPSSLSEVAES